MVVLLIVVLIFISVFHILHEVAQLSVLLLELRYAGLQSRHIH